MTMIYVDLYLGVVALGFALYGPDRDARILGGWAAGLALLIAMLAPGAW